MDKPERDDADVGSVLHFFSLNVDCPLSRSRYDGCGLKV